MIDALTVDLANQALPVRPRNHNADISGPYISSPVISSPTATSPRASNPRSISLTTRPGPPSTPASSVILPDRAPRSNTISTSAPSSAPALQRSATHTGHALPQPMVLLTLLPKKKKPPHTYPSLQTIGALLCGTVVEWCAVPISCCCTGKFFFFL